MEPKQPVWQTTKAWWAPVLSVTPWDALSYSFIKKKNGLHLAADIIVYHSVLAKPHKEVKW